MSWRHLAWDAASATLLLLLPLLVFFKYNDYSLWHTEIGICCLWIAFAGLFWGLLMWLGRTVGRVLITTGLLVLLVDVQTDWLTTVGLRLGLNILGFGMLTILLRRRLSRVVVVLCGAMVLVTVVQSPGSMVHHRGDFPGDGVGNQPFVLHIILDEYAAPEALDRSFDTDGIVAAGITDFFLDHDFTLFSRAYSRLFNTAESIPNILNRGLTTTPNAYWDKNFTKGSLLTRNDWFSRLRSLGYDLHVFQSDFITYAAPDAAGALPPGVSTSRYTIETVHALNGVDLAVNEKVRFIFGSYYRLSWFLGMFRDAYAEVRRSPVGAALRLPDWDRAGDRVSPLSTMQAVDDLTELLQRARPGQAVFAHLLLPHFPYAFQADCSLEPMGRMWLNAFDERLHPVRNVPAGRALRYPLYLNQLQCTNRRLADMFAALERAGVWDDALIILHSDHGSRLNLTEPLPEFAAQMSAEDDMDAFGALLAIKWPGGRGRLDRRLVSLGDVFEYLFLDPESAWPPGDYTPPVAEVVEPWVLLNDRKRVLQRHKLQNFAHGRAGVTDAATSESLAGQKP